MAIEYKRFHLNISPKLYLDLQKLAKGKEMTMTGLIRYLLRKGVTNEADNI